MKKELKPAHLTFRFATTLADLADDWDAAAPSSNLFLQRRYLEILEQNPPLEMRFRYLVFYENALPVGVAYCQIKHFKAGENIRDGLENEQRDPCFFDSLFRWMRRRFAGLVATDILICGNMLLTGENAFFVDNQRVTTAEFMPVLERGVQAVIDDFEKKGGRIPAILHKDRFANNREPGLEHLVENGFIEFEIQPNMIFEIRPDWLDFEHYVAALGKKYRTRTRRAFKKKDGIRVHEFSANEVAEHLPRLYELYRAIAKNAGFNMVDLNENYLFSLKKRLPGEVQIFGYFIDNQLVAFFSTIKNGSELEAHYLGYDQALNHDFQVYLNILYDIVRLGIEGRFERIIFARTALEIKSSIGAEAHEMFCYLRQQNSFANIFTGRALEFLKPVEKWTPRHPFLESEE